MNLITLRLWYLVKLLVTLLNALGSLGWVLVCTKVIVVFVLLNFAIWYWNTFLNARFLLFWGGANELSLAVYFICILDHGNDVRQKATFSNFLVGVQNGFWIKQQRQLATLTTDLAQELLMNIQCSGGSGRFAKEMAALKMRSTVAGRQKWQQSAESIINAGAVTTTWEVAPELNMDPSTVVWCLKQIGKWQSSISGCFRSWLQKKKKKKIIVLKCCLLLIYVSTM